MFGLFNRKPDTAWVDRYEAVLASKDETIVRICNERNDLRAVIARMQDNTSRITTELRNANIELAKFRAARTKQIANLAAANERRRAAKIAAGLPDGLYEKDGSAHFDCGACGRPTPWEGEVSDFQLGDYTNLCGGSPRCIP